HGRQAGHLQGPAQGQHRQGGHRRRRGAAADRHRAREDELPGRGRRREDSVAAGAAMSAAAAPAVSSPPPGRSRAEGLLIPLGAVVVSLLLFGVFVALAGANPLEVFYQIWRGAFGTWFSFQNTL